MLRNPCCKGVSTTLCLAICILVHLGVVSIVVDGADAAPGTDLRTIEIATPRPPNTPVPPPTPPKLPPGGTPAPPPISFPEAAKNILVAGASALSIGFILFAMVLYGHTPHLHTAGNNLFMVVILVNLLQAINYFACIVFVDIYTQRSSVARCQACGFLEQFFSFAEPCLNAVFWAHVALECNGKHDGFRRKFIVGFVVAVAIVGLGSSFLALALDYYDSENQAWCWITSRAVWFRVAFCWAWIGVTILVMIAAIGQPLCALTGAGKQDVRRFLLRRGVMALLWGLVNGINILARVLTSEPAEEIWTVIQALLNPSTGTLNVIAFLYSEAYLSCAMWARSPKADSPPIGFTLAVKSLSGDNRPVSNGYHNSFYDARLPYGVPPAPGSGNEMPEIPSNRSYGTRSESASTTTASDCRARQSHFGNEDTPFLTGNGGRH
jgi:hypothetical protein